MAKRIDNMFYGASPVLFEFARQLRANETPAEKLIWKYLAKKQIANSRFRRQHPILYFIADFYCHEARLIIEIDGGIHRLPAQHEYDTARDHELSIHGLQVIRFTNEQVFTDIEAVIENVRSHLTLKSEWGISNTP